MSLFCSKLNSTHLNNIFFSLMNTTLGHVKYSNDYYVPILYFSHKNKRHTAAHFEIFFFFAFIAKCSIPILHHFLSSFVLWGSPSLFAELVTALFSVSRWKKIHNMFHFRLTISFQFCLFTCFLAKFSLLWSANLCPQNQKCIKDPLSMWPKIAFTIHIYLEDY